MNTTPEEWHDIPGFGGRYAASNLGRIKSLPRTVRKRGTYDLVERVLRPASIYPGHLVVNISPSADELPRTRLVHRLVMLAFVGPCPEGQEVRHLDGDPSNNRLDNLAYGTQAENNHDRSKHGTWSGRLTDDDVRNIRLALSRGLTGAGLARTYGVSAQTISRVKRGESYGWVS